MKKSCFCESWRMSSSKVLTKTLELLSRCGKAALDQQKICNQKGMFSLILFLKSCEEMNFAVVCSVNFSDRCLDKWIYLLIQLLMNFFSVKNNDPKKKSKSCTECSSRWYTEESEQSGNISAQLTQWSQSEIPLMFCRVLEIKCLTSVLLELFRFSTFVLPVSCPLPEKHNPSQSSGGSPGNPPFTTLPLLS